jgi:hypothetical protein
VVRSSNGILTAAKTKRNLVDESKSPGTISSWDFDIDLSTFRPSDTLFLYVKGNYKNNEGLSFDIDQMVDFVPSLNECSGSDPDRKEVVKSYVNSLNKISTLGESN